MSAAFIASCEALCVQCPWLMIPYEITSLATATSKRPSSAKLAPQGCGTLSSNYILRRLTSGFI